MWCVVVHYNLLVTNKLPERENLLGNAENACVGKVSAVRRWPPLSSSGCSADKFTMDMEDALATAGDELQVWTWFGCGGCRMSR